MIEAAVIYSSPPPLTRPTTATSATDEIQALVGNERRSVGLGLPFGGRRLLRGKRKTEPQLGTIDVCAPAVRTGTSRRLHSCRPRFAQLASSHTHAHPSRTENNTQTRNMAPPAWIKALERMPRGRAIAIGFGGCLAVSTTLFAFEW